MRLSIDVRLSYATSQPCDILLQIEAGSDAQQTCHHPQITFDQDTTYREVSDDQGVGIRRWVSAGPSFECRYQAAVEVHRERPNWGQLAQTAWAELSGDTIQYLMPSRYCHSDQFLDFVGNQFAGLTGGDLIAAMSDWIFRNFTYDLSSSHVGTTATDSFVSMRGVCRDYAHVLITLARAAGIPSRFVSVYAPDVKPQDFHAVVEVYLEGCWHLIDPTGMANAAEIVRICVGRDAADASFMTSYGWMELKEQRVQVTSVTN